jgi:hypothetical protein
VSTQETASKRARETFMSAPDGSLVSMYANASAHL